MDFANILSFMDRSSQPAKPQYTQQAIAERQTIEQRISENKAKLETFRLQENEFRTILVATYRSLAYQAKDAADRMSNRQWHEGVSLLDKCLDVRDALDAHTNCIDEIARIEVSIAEDQAELDDDALWVTDAGYRRSGVR